MVRFFVLPEVLNSDIINLSGENASHAKVLRLKVGEEVLLCDGQGRECVCTIEDVAANDISLCVKLRQISSVEANVRASIYIAFSKGDKLEHVIQKATELGAYEIIAFPSARCVSKPDEKSLKKKLERWKKIAISAAEQSGRGLIPRVLTVDSFQNAVAHSLEADCSILFYENEKSTTLGSVLQRNDYSTISLMTGPEGGFESWEVDWAGEQGMKICTLGKRILRCETAPLCALSAVMYDAGEF